MIKDNVFVIRIFFFSRIFGVYNWLLGVVEFLFVYVVGFVILVYEVNCNEGLF